MLHIRIVKVPTINVVFVIVHDLWHKELSAYLTCELVLQTINSTFHQLLNTLYPLRNAQPPSNHETQRAYHVGLSMTERRFQQRTQNELTVQTLSRARQILTDC